MTIQAVQFSGNKEAQRFGRFLAVGLSGTILDFTLLTLLKLLGLPTLLANTFSFSAGVVNNFTWNRRWTFAGAERQGFWRQLGQFTAVSLIGLLFNNGIITLLEAPLGGLINQPDWGYLPAKLIATGLVVFWNYLANRYWTFSERGK